MAEVCAPLTNQIFESGYKLGILTSTTYPRMWERLMYFQQTVLKNPKAEPAEIDVEQFLSWLVDNFDESIKVLSEASQQRAMNPTLRSEQFRRVASYQGALGESWYFLFEVMKGFSDSYRSNFDAYQKLALYRLREPYSVIILNYDTLFEAAILSVGLSFQYLPPYPVGSIPIAKVHGSINWLNPAGRGIAFSGIERSKIFECITSAIYSNTIKVENPQIVDPRLLFRIKLADLFRSGTDYHIPIIIPPLGGHKDFSASDLYQATWNSAEGMLKDTSELVLIGTSLREQDKRLCYAIGRNLRNGTKVVAVRSKEAKQRLDKILPWTITDPIKEYESFEHYSKSL